MTDEPVEGGPGERWYNVRLSQRIFDELGLKVRWGKPDADGFYTPIVVTECNHQGDRSDAGTVTHPWGFICHACGAYVEGAPA